MAEPVEAQGNVVEPGPEEVMKHGSDQAPPPPDVGSKDVEAFHEADKRRKRSIFQYLAYGVAYGSGKVAGEHITDIPEYVHRFLHYLG
jgi:hypothetical protein